MRTGLIATLAIAMTSAGTVRAQIAVTFEAPGRMTTQTSGAVTQNFNLSSLQGVYGPAPQTPGFEFAQTANFGQYRTPNASGMQVRTFDVNGGAGQSNYFVVAPNSSATLTTNGSIGYFGLYLTAGDSSNQVLLQKSIGGGNYTTTYSFSVGDLLAGNQLLRGDTSGTDSHFGNPEPGTSFGQNAGEAYVYLNFYAQTAADKFDRVLFSQDGSGFESDNHSQFAGLIDPMAYTGTLFNPSPVPEPVGLLALAAVGFCGFRRFRAA